MSSTARETEVAGEKAAHGRPTGRRAPRPEGATAVPGAVRDAASWTWRLLLLALAAYLLVDLMGRLTVLVLPLLGALFFTALLQPVASGLRDLRLPRSLAALLAVLLLAVVVAAVAVFAGLRGSSAVPELVDQAGGVVTHLGDLVRRTPLGNGNQMSVDRIQQNVLDYLAAHRNTLLQEVLAGLRLLLETLAALVLGVFFTLYFLYDGEGIWAWLVGLVPEARQERVDLAGRQAWRRVGGFVRGTFVIAAFHGIVVGIVLWLLGTPLIFPLALLVFVGSFIPIVGAVVFGGLALLVTLVSQGVVPALIFLVVLVIENQVEAHVLQPFLVGRFVRLHPVAIAVVITGGGLLAGVPGAIVAIPLVSAVHGAVKVLRRTPSLTRSTRSRSTRSASPSSSEVHPHPAAWASTLPGQRRKELTCGSPSLPPSRPVPVSLRQDCSSSVPRRSSRPGSRCRSSCSAAWPGSRCGSAGSAWRCCPTPSRRSPLPSAHSAWSSR